MASGWKQSIVQHVVKWNIGRQLWKSQQKRQRKRTPWFFQRATMIQILDEVVEKFPKLDA
jgi:hypothetical protein